MDGGGSGQQAILGAETEDRLVEEHEPAATAVGVGGELVGQAGEAGVEEAVESLLAQRTDLAHRDRQRVEPEGDRLGVEVAARVEAFGLRAVGLEVQRAVGDGNELPLDLPAQLVGDIERGAVDLGKHA